MLLLVVLLLVLVWSGLRRILSSPPGLRVVLFAVHVGKVIGGGTEEVAVGPSFFPTAGQNLVW